MKKFIFALLLFATQQVFAQSNKQLSISPLYESGLIPIKEGETFKLSPNVIFSSSKHHVVKGALKAAGAFALTNKATQVIGVGKSGNSFSGGNLLPSIGIGLLAGLPDMIKGFKKNKIYVSYTFYDANQQLISTKKVQITKNTNEIVTDKAIKEGYVKVLVIGNSKSFYFKNIIINSKDPAEDYSGGVATTMDLITGADCNGGGGEDVGNDELAGCNNATTDCEKKKCASLEICVRTYNTNKQNCRDQYSSSPIALRACLDAAFEVEAQCCKDAASEYRKCAGI